MPQYEYLCKKCGVTFQSHSNIEKICPECGEKALQRKWRSVPIIYRTPGFYSSDNKDKK